MQEPKSKILTVLGEHVRCFKFAQPSIDVYLLPTAQFSIDDLKQQLPEPLFAHACERYKAEKRRFEFLATRLLLRAVLGSAVEIAYHPTGRPYLSGNSELNVSVSHTDGFVAIALSAQRVGLDIEPMSSRQLRLRERFMALAEWEQAVQFASPEAVAAIGWSAKEALYKLIDVPGTDLLDGLACEWHSAGLLSDVQRSNEVRIRTYGDLIIAVATAKQDSGN